MTRTYADMAKQLGLEPLEGFDIPVTWPNTKHFLKMAAVELDPTINDLTQPVWRRVYRVSIAARDVGKRLHIRVPSRYLTFDRHVVRAGVAGLSNEVPLRKQAFDWSRR